MLVLSFSIAKLESLRQSNLHQYHLIQQDYIFEICNKIFSNLGIVIVSPLRTKIQYDYHLTDCFVQFMLCKCASKGLPVVFSIIMKLSGELVS